MQKDVIRRDFKHEESCLETFMKCMNLLTEHVEKKISDILPSKLALVFGGWSSNSTHYFSFSASFSSSSELQYNSILLTISSSAKIVLWSEYEDTIVRIQ